MRRNKSFTYLLRKEKVGAVEAVVSGFGDQDGIQGKECYKGRNFVKIC